MFVLRQQVSVTIHTDTDQDPGRQLEVFDNPNPARDYTIRINIPEFTCLCPKTGQPDFATLDLEYVPGARCVELKSLKLYIHAFRQVGAFHEAVTNRILDDLTAAISPRFMRLSARFNVRGGLYTTIVAEHRIPSWDAAASVALPESSKP
jgi:7-cyano-7-deazaguanine reductase